MRFLRFIGWGIVISGVVLAMLFSIWMCTGFSASWQREVVVACKKAEPVLIVVEVRQVSGSSIRVRVSNRSAHTLALNRKPESNAIAVSMSLFYRNRGDLGIPVDDRPDSATQPVVIPAGGSIEREVDLAVLVKQQARENRGRIIRVGSVFAGMNPLANVPFKAEAFISLSTAFCGEVELLPPTKITIAMPNTCQFDEECAKHGRGLGLMAQRILLSIVNLTENDYEHE